MLISRRQKPLCLKEGFAVLAGLSTACFYPELTERGLMFAASIGAQAAEVFFNAPSELTDSFVRELRRIADGSGTRILSVHPFTSGLEPLLFFSGYRRRFCDGVELYKRYFHAANLLGANLLVFAWRPSYISKAAFCILRCIWRAGGRGTCNGCNRRTGKCSAARAIALIFSRYASIPAGRAVCARYQTSCARGLYARRDGPGNGIWRCPSACERSQRKKRLPADRNRRF